MFRLNRPHIVRYQFVLKILAPLFVCSLLSGCFAGAKKARVQTRADQYFKSGEYDKAKIEYLNLLRLAPKDAVAYERLGYIWLEEGVPLRGIPFLLRVRELAPNDIAARSKLAQSLVEIGQLGEARKELLEILKKDPANSEAIVTLAQASQAEEDEAVTEQQLQKFPAKDTAAFHLAAATLALRKGQNGQAADELQQGLKLDPKSPKLHMSLAYLYLVQNDSARAGEEVKAASDVSPPRGLQRLKYAQFQAANGHPDEARAVVEDLTHRYPDYVAAWGVLAQISYGQKKYDEALSQLENVFTRDAQNPDARLLQSEIFLAKGDSKNATNVLDRLNTTYPRNPVIKYRLAQAYLSSGNLNQATLAAEDAVAANPKYVEAILTLCQLYVRSGKPQQAISRLEDLVKKYPKLTLARTTLADAYAQAGKLDDVVALFQDELKLEPNSAEAYFRLGLVLRLQRKNKEARAAFEKAAEIAQHNLGAVDELVQLDLLDRNYESATQRVQVARKENPTAPDVFVMEAKIYGAQRDWGHAEQSLRKALELDPNSQSATALLISIYATEKKLPELRKELEDEVAKHPSNNNALMQLGQLYESLGEFPKAKEVYERFLANAPEAVPVLNNLAYLEAEHLNQLDKAYELAQKARSLNTTNPSVADTLGWILYKRGEYQQAVALLQEGASKLADNPEVQFHLGMAGYMMGQADLARVALERAAQADKDFPGKEEAKRRLASLQSGSVPRSTDIKGNENAQPDDVIELTRAAEAAEQKGNAAEAAAAYQKLLQVNPKLPGATIKLAQLYAGPLHDLPKATDLANKARSLAPNDPQTALVAGHVALQASNFSWAYSLLQENARKGNKDLAGLRDFALAAYALGKVPEARQIMQAVLDAKPAPEVAKEAESFMKFTALEQPSPDVIAAEAQIEARLRDQPEDVPALMAHAAVQLQRGQSADAATTYSKILQGYPDFAPAQKRLAGIYEANSEQVPKAYELAMKARKTLPTDVELARTLARLSFKRNEFAYAAQLYQQSTGGGSSLSATDLYYLGVAQFRSRDQEKGRASLQQALQAGLSGKMAEDAKDLLSGKEPK